MAPIALSGTKRHCWSGARHDGSRAVVPASAAASSASAGLTKIHAGVGLAAMAR
jgi:hypothetical protein